ncbi:TetR/AcrR family transcriptional regulator [Nonomuraea sp. SBT364]|uniref:TetR/AcrR family transcriptional regulator n=1 Tax=Nonomuraea sp. SBT364 TaxID=1580530 RepID=UPI00066C221F|nr:TetR/AcrR family transcriptional regulator [Nonomuraea sp. SBT364]
MTRTEPRRDGPGRPRDPEADGAILRAAIALLAERGVDRTSIEAIARRAGVTKVTVYRRWRTKDELLAQAIETARDDLPNVAEAVEGTLPEVIERLLPRWGEVLAEPRFRALSAQLLAAGAGHPALLEAYRRHHVLPRRERAREVMRRAQRDGHLSPAADPDVLADMMEGAVIYKLLLSPSPLGPAEISAYLRALLVQAGFSLPGGPVGGAGERGREAGGGVAGGGVEL